MWEYQIQNANQQTKTFFELTADMFLLSIIALRSVANITEKSYFNETFIIAIFVIKFNLQTLLSTDDLILFS